MRRRAGVILVGAALAVGGLSAPAPAGALAVPAAAAVTAVTADGVDVDLPRVELPRPVRGAAAVRLLGDDLGDAAALNGMTAPRLTDLLRSDPSAWLSTQGRLQFRDPARPAAAGSPVTVTASYPLAQTFDLHSNPGSDRVIFIDVDGAAVSDTAWHADHPSTPTTQPAWDPAGDGPAFSDAELAAVQRVWELVAEDYAPFDVDVTTEDPGPAAILRSSAGDPTFGAHALVTPSEPARTAVCNDCGGIAQVGVVGMVQEPGGDGYGRLQPAWIFPQALGDSPKAVAETVSHEVGHQLGLLHDGSGVQEYDPGVGAWAPIMGTGFYRPITQWSDGARPGATNHQDDVALIAAVLSERPDEAPSGVGSAPEVPDGTARVTRRDDVDTYLLGTCTGPVQLVATPLLATGADVDLTVRLLDADGELVASADPPSTLVDAERADGLGATLSTGVVSGTYYASVDGVGDGSTYDDYGSLGAYTLDVGGDCALTGRPRLPGQLAATASTTTSVTLSWAAPTDPGSSAVTGYVVARTGSADPVTLPAGTTSHTWTGLAPGTSYTFTVAAANATGTGASGVVVASTAAAPPGAAEAVSVTWDAVEQAVLLSWEPPSSDGGAPVTHYDLWMDGDLFMEVPDAGPFVYVVEFTGLAPGAHTFGVAAVNAAGSGPRTDGSVVVPGLLPSTTTLTASAAGAAVTLAAAVSVSGAAPAGTVEFHDGPALVGTRPLSGGTAVLRLPGVGPGRHSYRATFVPTGSDVAGSTSTSAAVTVAASKLPAQVTLQAPATAKAGTRPSVTVRVRRGSGPAVGTVTLAYGAKSVRLALRNGAASYRLPRLKVGTLRLSATYAGNATTTGDSASTSMRVRRR